MHNMLQVVKWMNYLNDDIFMVEEWLFNILKELSKKGNADSIDWYNLTKGFDTKRVSFVIKKIATVRIINKETGKIIFPQITKEYMDLVVEAIKNNFKRLDGIFCGGGENDYSDFCNFIDCEVEKYNLPETYSSCAPCNTKKSIVDAPLLSLPSIFATQKAKRAFSIAIEKGLMSANENGTFSWTNDKRGYPKEICCFIGVLLCGDTIGYDVNNYIVYKNGKSQFPFADVERVFCVKNMRQAHEQMHERKPPKIYSLIKEIVDNASEYAEKAAQ